MAVRLLFQREIRGGRTVVVTSGRPMVYEASFSDAAELSLRDPAEALRLDPKCMVEAAPEVLERDVRGQLHEGLRREVFAKSGKGLVVGVPARDRHPVGIGEHLPLERREEWMCRILIEVGELLVRNAGRLARGGVDVYSERASVEPGDTDIHEILEGVRDERRLAHGLAPRLVRDQQRGVMGQ